MQIAQRDKNPPPTPSPFVSHCFRAIRLGGLSTGEAVALVPYADLFNHNPFANSYIDARQSGFFTKIDEVVVYADRSYKKMEQVTIGLMTGGGLGWVRLGSVGLRLLGLAWLGCSIGRLMWLVDWLTGLYGAGMVEMRFALAVDVRACGRKLFFQHVPFSKEVDFLFYERNGFPVCGCFVGST